jgi:cytochrome c oxidase subunit III
MSEAIHRPPLLSGSIGSRASGWWGMVFLTMSESSLFAYLFFAYFYFGVHRDYRPWPPYGPPSLRWPIVETVVLFAGVGGAWLVDRRARVRVGFLPAIGLAATALLGCAFILLGLLDWSEKPFRLSSDAYASIYFMITGIHLAHTAIGVLMAAAVAVWSGIGSFGPVRHAPIKVAALYWYFLGATWAALFFVLYITPYLGS